jgi:hypothetical protein
MPPIAAPQAMSWKQEAPKADTETAAPEAPKVEE